MNRLILLLTVVVFLLVTGCSGGQDSANQSEEVFATPTLHPIFNSEGEVKPAQLDFGEEDSPTTTPTPAVENENQPTPTIRPTIAAQVITLYDDALNENWTLENSNNFDYDLEADQVVNTGQFSMALTPEMGRGKFRMTVSPDSEEVFRREDVLAFRFWLYSGDDYIGTEELSVTVVGSNEYTYWVEDDDSVQIDDEFPTFPQTRLYYLDINRDIPPETWVQIEVWLDERIYDPDYLYVTGMIIENEEGFLRTFFVDDVEMVILR